MIVHRWASRPVLPSLFPLLDKHPVSHRLVTLRKGGDTFDLNCYWPVSELTETPKAVPSRRAITSCQRGDQGGILSFDTQVPSTKTILCVTKLSTLKATLRHFLGLYKTKLSSLCWFHNNSLNFSKPLHRSIYQPIQVLIWF